LPISLLATRTLITQRQRFANPKPYRGGDVRRDIVQLLFCLGGWTLDLILGTAQEHTFMPDPRTIFGSCEVFVTYPRAGVGYIGLIGVGRYVCLYVQGQCQCRCAIHVVPYRGRKT
jgi:hypothetical protein